MWASAHFSENTFKGKIMLEHMSAAKADQTLAKQEITNLQNMDLSSTRPQTMVLCGLGVGAVLLSGMFITTIISGIFAIVLTAGAGFGGWICLKNIKTLEPAMREKARNKILEMRIAQAKEKSMIHLQNQVLDNTAKMDAAKVSTQKIQAQVMSLSDAFDKADPTRKSYKKKRETLDMVKVAAEAAVKAYRNALAKNKEFELEVEDHRSLAKFNDAAGDIVALLNKSGGKGIDDILNITAFESISDSFNESIVAINFGAAEICGDL